MKDRLRAAAATVQDVLADPKVRKVLALGVLLGLLAYAAAGLAGLLALGVLLGLAAWFRPVRQRVLRWYLLA